MANLERLFNHASNCKNEVSTLSNKGHMGFHGFRWKDRGDESVSTPNAEPTMDTSQEPASEITLPAAPPTPLPQSFKCEKCGAAFADEGAAAAHIQTCKGPEGSLEPTPN